MKERESVLEKEKLQTELNYLKAQINPHFLFNVLGTIHALSRNTAPQAADVTLKLSQLMRFMLYDARSKQITLGEEVKMLEDFIELERVRFSNKLQINFSKNIENSSLPIAPLLLLPFVENAFKYSAAESRFNAFVQISLTVQGGRLHLEVENSVEEPVQHHASTHIGLANIQRQLELMYPDRQLVYEKREKTFFVSLRINLYQHEKS
jgi:two-component system, LytTR family, sensor kinase